VDEPKQITIEAFGVAPVPRRAVRTPELAWRRYLAQRSIEAVEPMRPLAAHRSSRFTVQIEFFLPSLAADLDNLVERKTHQ
jgi:hypothetical protein